MLTDLTLIMTIILNMSLLVILMRLEVKHKIFSGTGSGGKVYGCIDKLAGVLEFILTRKYAELHDPVLTASCLIFILSFLTCFPLMLISILFR